MKASVGLIVHFYLTELDVHYGTPAPAMILSVTHTIPHAMEVANIKVFSTFGGEDKFINAATRSEGPEVGFWTWIQAH